MKRRESDIEDSISEDIILLFSIKVYNSLRNEKYLHWKYRIENSPDKFGSGKTEWFLLSVFQILSCIIYLISIYIAQQLQVLIMFSVALFSLLILAYYLQ